MSAKPLKIGHRPDYFLMAVIFVLTIFGLAMLASASSELGEIKFGDGYYYIKHQLLYGLSVGAAGLLLGYLMHYQRWKKFAIYLLLGGLFLLTLVFTSLGVSANNATRWITIGPINFQPAEVMKLAFIIYIAAWASNPKAERAKNFVQGLLPFLAVSGAIALLLIFQPATSTMVILLLSGLSIYFFSGAKLRYITSAVLIGVLLLAVFIAITPYRMERILSFLNPGSDIQGTGYHINQALIAIASGGFSGVGYGQSATKANYLPAPIDDSIFAIIAEELGFIGASFVAVLFAMFVLRLFWIAKKTRDHFGRLFLIGLGTLVALQSFVNMAAISGIIPLTGVPLPFISYGGTSLAVFLTMSGIALNVSKYS